MKKFISFILITIFFTTGCTQTSEVTPSQDESLPNTSIASESSQMKDNKDTDSSSQPAQNNTNTAASLNDIKQKYIEPFGYLVYTEDWSNPTEIEGHMLLTWYREYLQEALSIDVHYDRYSNKELQGFLYPAAEYEAFVLQYLGISKEQLRTVPQYQYNSQYDGYVLEGGARGEQLKLEIESESDIINKDDEIIITLKVVNDLDQFKEYKILTIKNHSDGSFQYNSYITDKKAS